MKRDFSSDLLAWKNSAGRKPLVVRGARQVGKTYSLKEFARSQFRAFHYLNFEEDPRLADIFEGSLEPGRVLDEMRFRLNRNIDAGRDLIILDEVQRCGRALTSLKYFCEEMPEAAICAAGSLLGVTLSADSFPVGKVTFLDLHPMSFVEFLEGIGEELAASLHRGHDPRMPYPRSGHERLWELWKQYLVVGGLPAAVVAFAHDRTNLFEATRRARDVQRDLVRAYLADIAKHGGKVNALHIERVWQSVPAQLARAHDGSAPKFKFRDVVPGIRGYARLAGPIDWLQAAGLVLRTSMIEAPSIPLSGFAYENRFKLYLFDIGMLGALADIPPAILLRYGFGSYQGWVAENAVAQALHTAGVRNLYCWTGRTSEVEFVVQAGAGVVPIEVKSGATTRSKSLGVYEQKYSPPLAVVLSARNSSRSPGRMRMPLYAAARVGTAIAEELAGRG